jgi:hypothetical protein
MWQEISKQGHELVILKDAPKNNNRRNNDDILHIRGWPRRNGKLYHPGNTFPNDFYRLCKAIQPGNGGGVNIHSRIGN